MIRRDSWTAIRALSLSVLVVVSLSAVAVPLSGNALGAVANDSLVVTDAPVQPDGSITVEGETGNSEVTFLIQDPDTGAASTHTVSGLSTSGTFSTTLDLGSDFGIDYSDGEATLMADEGAEFVTAEDTTSFQIDTQDPTVDIESPADGADRTSAPTVSGSASDDHSVDRVELSLQNESTGQYYNADTGNWQNTRAWLTASGTTDWSYDTAGVTDDGTYEVAVRVFDDAGNNRSYLSGPQSYSDDNTLHVTYTVDTAAPTVTAVDATELNGDDTVEVGDTVNVSATVTDATAGVDTVTVDSSALHTSDSTTLVQSSGDTYVGSFNVTEPSVGDGTVSLTVNATDAFGQSQTGSDTVTLETHIDSVETLTVHQDFVGIVEDDNRSVAVTATGVRDPRGKLIASGSGATEEATLDIAGTSFVVDVNDGEIDDTIDPTKIANDAATGETTVEITETEPDGPGDSVTTTEVTLVHEANALESGYQIEATPMDATAVEYQHVDSALTYDPETSSWVTPEDTRAGSAYYLNGMNDDARVGYTFAQDGELNSRYLHEGYNLVGATPDLNDGDTVQAGSDLGDAVTVSGNSNIEVYTRDESETLSEPSGSTDADAFDKGSSSSTVGPYEGYYVYVESGEVVRVTEKADYEPGQGS